METNRAHGQQTRGNGTVTEIIQNLQVRAWLMKKI